MKKYIAKPGTWFDEGTEAVPVTFIWQINEHEQAAIFLGTRNGKPDEEQCCLDEFDAVEVKPSPEEFAEAMKTIKDKFDDPEIVHERMDNLVCELLKELGYEDGVEIFEKSEKWYS